MRRWIRVLLVTLLCSLGALLLLQGCGGEEGISAPEGSSSVTLSLSGLEPLSGGLNYQAWLVGGTRTEFFGVPVVLFNMNEAGEMVDPVADTVLTGPFHAGMDANAALGVAISLELTDEPVAYSSSTFILGGEVSQGTAILSADNWLSLNLDLSAMGGRFILATPTDEDPENELSGIWFMDPSSDPAEAGLSLPDGPAGWIYEGWVGLDSQPLSVGRFSSPNVDDSTSAYSGPLSGPTFPGEDFLTAAPVGLTFPPDLSEASVFVTMEPWAEWNVEPEDPFFLRILEARVPADAMPQTLYEMTSLADQLPTGTATIQDP